MATPQSAHPTIHTNSQRLHLLPPLPIVRPLPLALIFILTITLATLLLPAFHATNTDVHLGWHREAERLADFGEIEIIDVKDLFERVGSV